MSSELIVCKEEIQLLLTSKDFRDYLILQITN